MGTGRKAPIAGNRIANRYQSLTNALYALHRHMVQLTDALSKNGSIPHPDDFAASQFYQSAIAHGVVPQFRWPNPTIRIRPGLPYNENEVSEILPKFWKDVKEGRIFLVERLALSEEELFISRPTTTDGKKMPDRTISNGRRILRDGRLFNLCTPKCDCYRQYYAKIKDIAKQIIILSRSYP